MKAAGEGTCVAFQVQPGQRDYYAPGLVKDRLTE